MKLLILSIAALFCGGLRDTFATANTESPASADIAALKEQLASQQAEIAELRKAQSSPATSPAESVTSTTALLAKGAGVELSDVTWRIRAGLDAGQAVQAALQQKQFDDAKAAEAKAAKSKK